jgi:hypothetical protein
VSAPVAIGESAAEAAIGAACRACRRFAPKCRRTHPVQNRRPYGRLDLLLVDELGYVSVDPRGAELLFQVLTEREERASVAVASNHPFSEWGRTFTDPRLAVVDRLTFHAHLLETGTDSYRLRTARARKRTTPPASPQETTDGR